MTGLQSINQLYKIYGLNDALTMLDQFNTKFIFKTDDSNFANFICKNFGEIEYSESAENISYGAHEMRDGVSVSKIEKRRSLVTPADLGSLGVGEVYVSLPEPRVRVAKIKIGLKKTA
jgi:type IV secretory pathway TraG/TraD family ATPase VirD4